MNKTVITISCIIVWTFCLVSCGKKPTPPNPPVPVNLYTVKAQTVLYYDKYPATTVALNQVDLRPQVQGYITGIFFKDGDHVKKGQALYEIDKHIYQANYDQALANEKVAEGNLNQAQQDADRYNYLNTYNAVAKQLLDHAVIALQNAKNEVDAAKQSLKVAQANLSYSIITAPFDGTVGFSQVKMGNMVTVGQTILNTISSDDPMAVDFVISEKQLAHFEQLNNDKHAPLDSLFTILMPNGTLYPNMGKISVIDRSVDPQTGTIKIRLLFSNPDYLLRAGMSCVVRLHNEETTPQLLIPEKAIVEQMGEYFVFVAKDTILTDASDTTHKQKADTGAVRPKLVALQKKVMLGQSIGPNVIIKSGLAEGDQIVVDGIQTLHDGSKIALSKKQNTPADKGSHANKQDSSSTKSNTDKDGQ